VNGYIISYTYDVVGNRLTLVNGGAATTSTYDAGNQLVSSQNIAGITTYTFDGDGNQLTAKSSSNQLTSFSWDSENRMVNAALPSGTANTFSYNGDGQRVQKQDSSGTANHVWDSNNILLETSGSNVVSVVYTLEPATYGKLLCQIRSAASSVYLFDALGSTRQLSNQAQSVTDSYLYDTFGDVILKGATLNPFMYVGRRGYYYNPDTQDYYIRARIYNPTSGRFFSKGTLSSTIGRTNGCSEHKPIDFEWLMTSYLYALNNAANLGGPPGFSPLDLAESTSTYFPVNDDCQYACTYAQKQRNKTVGDQQGNPPFQGKNPGYVVCYGGTMCACFVNQSATSIQSGCDAFVACVMTHEKNHFPDRVACPAKSFQVTVPQWKDPANEVQLECIERLASVKCLQAIIDSISNKTATAQCVASQAAIQSSLDTNNEYIQKNKCQSGPVCPR
jgi:RHS repeat-associated protein